ncbi:MAG TPA: hypothetical protein VEA69_22895 [Tepidisphaeraceae bacterium]|nr:hypothetical protein [Tepidisphaeraceae bacterium]
MRIGLITIVVLGGALGCGCAARTLHEVVVQAYDARTKEPISGVRVVEWERFQPTTIAYQTARPLGVTGTDGLMVGHPRTLWPSYIFSRDGYESAEARVDGDAWGGPVAYVASPSWGNRWRRLYDGEAVPPTRYEEKRAVVRPMWRVEEG